MVGLYQNDQEDGREKHAMDIIDNGQKKIVLNFAFVWPVHLHETKDGQSLLGNSCEPR